MKSKLVIAVVFFLLCHSAGAITVSSGQLITYWQMTSEYIAPRDVHVWLPETYRADVAKGEKYAVLYMHDGQMLFDGQTTWNGLEWGIDEVASKLLTEEKVRKFIVVGVNNGGRERRHAEYFPQKPFQSLPDAVKDTLYNVSRSSGESLFHGHLVQSDQYLKFLVEELKPFIDAQFDVLTGRDDTYLMGSSMGGLISMYAISEYPEVFGGAACLSTHWPGIFSLQDNPIPEAFTAYMASSLPAPDSHRLYFDYGDQTLDAMYPALQKKADKVIASRGYSDDNWTTLFFPGDAHSEDAWRARLHNPLLFLFSKR